MKTILVPTDFSDCAYNALRFAAYISKKTGAVLNLLHVHNVPHLGPQNSVLGTVDDTLYMIELLKFTKKRMSKLLKSPFLQGLKVIDNIEVGGVTNSILKAAKEHKADLIIMGTHGTNGLGDILIGNNAEKVALKSTFPVLTIKHDIQNPKIEKIVFATDFSEECNLAFEKTLRFAKLFEAEVEVVNVITKQEFDTTRVIKQKIKKFRNSFKEDKFSVTPYYELDKQEGIRLFADEVKADVIALAFYGKHGLFKLFTGNLVEKMVNHSSLPILTVNLKKDKLKAF